MPDQPAAHPNTQSPPPAESDVGTLTGPAWRAAGRALLAKLLAEFSYEGLLSPHETGQGHYAVDLGPATYRFAARAGAYGHLHVDPASITRAAPTRRPAPADPALPDHSAPEPPQTTGEPADDPLRFVLDAAPRLGLGGDVTGHFIRELLATLAADTRWHTPDAATAADLADLSYAELEGHQTGHPWIVFNKGRLGFSATDIARHAPESRRPVRLPWLAVHHSLAAYRGVPGLDEERLLGEELDAETREVFARRLADDGHIPAEFALLPVHPWQWDETILPLFAAQIAAGLIVPLGEAPDAYLPQQSIRTFSNVSQPHRRHVKLPLSVLNTLVWRGLPTERTLAAPAVTRWLLGLRDADPYLADECRVILLGETASVTVRHPVLEEVPGVPYQYRELLGAIWREPLPPRLAPGERARTLASLLHVDGHGRAFTAELVERSGLSPSAWLRQLYRALLPPLLHFLHRYGVAFSPHGENAVVVFDEHDVPVRLAVKDFVDDVNIADVPLPELADLPAEVAEVLLREPAAFMGQFLHGALFVGHARYLADIAERHLGVPEPEFWAVIRDEIADYRARFPDLADRFALFDLTADRIERICLNRTRLQLTGYRDRPERPHALVNGTVPNPLAPPRTATVAGGLRPGRRQHPADTGARPRPGAGTQGPAERSTLPSP